LQGGFDSRIEKIVGSGQMKMKENQLEQPKKSIVEFLKKEGWIVIAVNGTRVMKNPNNGWGEYWFVMEFLGCKKIKSDEE